MYIGDFLSSFSIAISAVALWGHLPAAVDNRIMPRRAMLGVVMGLGAMGSMLHPIQVQPGVMLDFRTPLVASAAFVGGPLSAILAATLPLLFRWHLAGVGIWSGCAGIVLCASIGSVAHRVMVRPSTRGIALLSVCVALGSFASLLLLPRPVLRDVLDRGVLISLLNIAATWLSIICLRRDERLQDLIARNAVYKAIIEALPDSLNAKDRHSRFIAANPATARLMQTSSVEALIGKSDADFYTEAMARDFREEERRVIDDAAVGPFVQQVQLPDGSLRWLETLKTPLLDARGHISGIITHNRDVTDRERSKRELDEVQARFQAAISHMAEGLVIYDKDGIIRLCNQQYRDLFPMTADLRMAGRRFVDIARASVERGEEEPTGETEAWIADRFATLHRPGERLITLGDGRLLEERTRSMADGDVLLTLSDITELKRSESDAREANRRLLLAEEATNAGHWRFDVPSQMLTWSDEVYRIHGLDRTLYRPSIEEASRFYHPDDRNDVDRCIADALTLQKPYEFSHRIVRPGGEIRHVMCRGFCEVDAVSGRVTGLFGIVLDVSDLTQAQRALGEKSAHLEATLNTIDQGLLRVSSKGAVELANHRVVELLGLPPQVLETAPVTFDRLRDQLRARGDVIRTRETPATSHADHSRPTLYECTCSDGRVLEMRVVSSADGAELMTVANITERRHAEGALRDSEARYRMLADATSDVITQLDLDLNRRYVSPACRSMLGYEPEEMIGITPAAAIHPDDVNAVRSVMQRLCAGTVPGDRATTTNRMRHKQGHWIWLEAGINLVRDPATGAPKFLVCSMRDVTERQLSALQLEQAKVAAESATRLKSEFIANMSHELRTPLTGILGIHDLLASDPTLNDGQKRHVRLARDVGRSLLGIINEVLDFSKIEAGQHALESLPFDVAGLLDSCRSLAEREVRGKPLVIAAQAIGAPATLVGDAAKLRQVLSNLLSNAIKFTERGRITVDAIYRSETGRLRVEVSDTGIGVPNDKLPLLFERFSQADASITRRFGGTGLGLAISKRLVELMGGEIGLSSEVGCGSLFWFDVPLGAVACEPVRESRAPDTSTPSSRNVLLAEDNELNQEIIRSMLEQRGHRVTVVDNGLQAVEACRDGHGAGFDVVLMDLQMPVMDGLTATRAIRAIETVDGRAEMPIIGLTANVMVEDVERCLAAGMQAHAGKPIEWPDLFAVIDRVTVPCEARLPSSTKPRLMRIA